MRDFATALLPNIAIVFESMLYIHIAIVLDFSKKKDSSIVIVLSTLHRLFMFYKMAHLRTDFFTIFGS